MRTKEELTELAEQRAHEINEAWWYEDTGEFADEYELTDEELDIVLKTGIQISAS